MSTTFSLDDVSPGTKRFEPMSPLRALATTLLEMDLVFESDGHPTQVPSYPLEHYTCLDLAQGVRGEMLHPFVAAVSHAFNKHLPLRLSPDHLWALIGQGVAMHLSQHADTLGSRLVSHDGKVKLSVRNDALIPRQNLEEWRVLLGQFATKIQDHMEGDFVALMCPEFSTTGPLERAVFRAGLMNALKEYFEYEFVTACGIPTITLEGEVSDWEDLCERVKRLEAYDLSWWVPSLEKICGHFVRAAKGEPDLAFWRSMVKYHSQSGGNVWTGWVVELFPYLHHKGEVSPNPWLGEPWETFEQDPNVWPAKGVEGEHFGGAMSRTPVTWSLLGARHEMELLTGFTGTTQDPKTGEMAPSLGWAMRHASSKDE